MPEMSDVEMKQLNDLNSLVLQLARKEEAINPLIISIILMVAKLIFKDNPTLLTIIEKLLEILGGGGIFGAGEEPVE